MSEYYVDDEEVRYSVDGRSAPRQTSEQPRRNGHSRNSLNEEGEESDGESSTSSLGEDYEEILEQETFIFQLTFKDLLTYLLSDQEPLTLPPPRSSSSTSTPSSSDRVQSLPV